MQRFLFISLCFFVVTSGFGQTPKYSNAFLELGIGARAHGMGMSLTASANDVTSSYWNPAGLTDIQSNFQVGAMHSEWFAGIAKFDYLAIAKPLKNKRSVLGITAIRLGVDNIPNTFNLVEPDGSINYDNVTPFSAADYAGMLSFAQKVGEGKFSIGGNAKVVYRQVGQFANAWGFGMDLGIKYRTERIQIGIMARDISSTFNAWKFNFSEQEIQVLDLTNNEIPLSTLEVTLPKLNAGIAYTAGKVKRFSLLMELDVNLSFDGQRNVLLGSQFVNVDPTFGIEASYGHFVFLRGGINNVQTVKDPDNLGKEVYTFQPNAGIGVHFAGLHLDYAFTDLGDFSDAPYSHVVSLVLELSSKKEDDKVQDNVNPIPNQQPTSKPRRIIEQID